MKPREGPARNTHGRRLQGYRCWLSKNWQWNELVGSQRNRDRTKFCVKDEIREVKKHPNKKQERNKKNFAVVRAAHRAVVVVLSLLFCVNKT